MNPLKDGSTTRTKGSIKEIRHVYLDLDENAPDSLQAIRDSSDSSRAPTLCSTPRPANIKSCGRSRASTREQAECSGLRSLANQFDGDPAATDSTRVLRMPGFANRKYTLEKEFVVRVRQESDQVHHLRDFKLQSRLTGRSPPSPRRTVARKPLAQSSASSQSEHDWAYAKRALARGDDPEEVIRRITDYRATDKHDPAYYARHTVMKAQAALLRQNAIERPVEGERTEAKQIGFDH